MPAGRPAGGHPQAPLAARLPGTRAAHRRHPGTTSTRQRSQAEQPIRVEILGPVRITAAGRELQGGLRKARELAAFLALHPDGVSGEAISEALWPGSPPGHGTRQRSLALRKLRGMLRAATGLTAPMLITLSGGRYRLDPTYIATDVAAFQAALEEARTATTARCLPGRLPGSGRPVPGATGRGGRLRVGRTRTPRRPGAAPWTPGPASPNSSSPLTQTRPWPPWRPRSATTPTTSTSTRRSCGCRPQRATPRPSAGP